MSDREQGTQAVEQDGGAVTVPAATGAAAAGDGAAELEKVRGLVLQAHPDVVPDLVRGASVDELIASVEPARAAYQAVAERVRSGGAASLASAANQANGTGGGANGASASVGSGPAAPPAVPAGGAANVVDPASMPASEKIRRALEAQQKR
ncbi:MAG TPA: hypothetical protein VFI22_19565 [Thermomicrobiales bacterium]|nr:hypothetical protein [Thermomicrobiales bacterium]